MTRSQRPGAISSLALSCQVLFPLLPPKTLARPCLALGGSSVVAWAHRGSMNLSAEVSCLLYALFVHRTSLRTRSTPYPWLLLHAVSWLRPSPSIPAPRSSHAIRRGSLCRHLDFSFFVLFELAPSSPTPAYYCCH